MSKSTREILEEHHVNSTGAVRSALEDALAALPPDEPCPRCEALVGELREVADDIRGEPVYWSVADDLDILLARHQALAKPKPDA